MIPLTQKEQQYAEHLFSDVSDEEFERIMSREPMEWDEMEEEKEPWPEMEYLN